MAKDYSQIAPSDNLSWQKIILHFHPDNLAWQKFKLHFHPLTTYPVEEELNLTMEHSIQKLISYLTDTPFHIHYKYQLNNAISGNNRCLL
jgi:hypothetical protein